MTELTENIYCNRQRTSTKNGILKSEAVIMVLELLQRFGIETLKDVDKLIIEHQFESEIKKIPGQKSGISFKYFLMLCGLENFVKPDRMIIRFLESVAHEKIKSEDCQPILQETLDMMNQKGFNLTLRKLDNLIWNYQRSLK